MIKKISFWVLVVLFVGGIIYGYFYLSAAKKPKVMAVMGIPDDCTFVVETNDFFKLWKKLNETNLIWQELQQVDYFKDLQETGKMADSVLYADESTRELFKDNKIYLAAIETGSETRDYLYALNVNLGDNMKLFDFVKKISMELEEVIAPVSKEKIWKFKLKAGKGILFLYSNEGLVLISKNSAVIDKSISSINKNCLGNDARFRKISDMAGSSVDFRFYLNNAHSGNIYRQYLKRSSLCEALTAKEVRGWAEMDIDFMPNEMKANGFVLPDSSSFLNYLAEQAPQEYNFIHAAPQSTDNFLFIGVENFSGFYDKMEDNVLTDIDRNNHKAVFENLSEKVGLNLKDKILGAVGNEIAALRTHYSDSLKDNYCMVHLADREEEEKDFHLITDSIIHASVKVNEEEQSDSIYYFKNAELIATLTCGLITRPFQYCFFYDDYLVFCESQASWGRYLNEVSKGKTLAKNDNFMRFREGNISEESNFFAYTFFSTSKDILPSLMNEKIKEEVEKYSELFNKFHSGGFQLSSYKGMLLNQAYVLYSPIYNRQNNSVWEVKLDSDAVMRPEIVLNHKTGLEEIFTQDAADNIYLISNTGKILWKKRIEGKIKSEIFQLDFFKNNKLQIMFSTDKAVHLIDRNGNYVQGYPLQFTVPPANGINVFDYEKNHDYRIIYSGTDKKVYLYKGAGTPVEGFNFEGTADTVNVAIRWERINFRDYLLAFYSNGNIYGFGRKGEKRLDITAKAVMKNFSYSIETGKDIDKTKLYFFDGDTRKIMKLFLNNKKEEFPVPTELSNPVAFFARINDDSYYDLILVEENKIEIYDDQGNLLRRLKTGKPLRPFFRQLQRNNEFFYAFIDEENNLLMIPSNWQVPENPSIKCTQLPSVEMLNDDGYFYLIGINKDLVSCYPF